jgi:hypothetical protein
LEAIFQFFWNVRNANAAEWATPALYMGVRPTWYADPRNPLAKFVSVPQSRLGRKKGGKFPWFAFFPNLEWVLKESKESELQLRKNIDTIPAVA